jgi:enoyl-CoA hydratase / 3-hydroxyacyl-CoA dehydrogenase
LNFSKDIYFTFKIGKERRLRMRDVKFRKITVIGAGTMGHGITEVFLLSKVQNVFLNDISSDALQIAKKKIRNHLEKWDSKDLLSKEIKETEIMEKLILEKELNNAIKNADLIIEVVPEDITLKENLLRNIGKNTPEKTIIASNTSTFTITELGEFTGRPESTIGMHFFVPPFNQDCIEVMRGDKTSDEVFEKTIEFSDSIPSRNGTMYVAPIQKDTPGFISNRILIPISLYINVLADKAAESGIPLEQLDADVQHIMKLGPYELADYLGLDTNYKSLKSFEKRVSADFAPRKVISELVSKGHYGRKTGKGFHKWDENGNVIIDKSKKAGILNPEMLLAIQLNEGCKMLEEEIVTSYKIIDKVMERGIGMPGPFLPGKRNYKRWAKMLEEFAKETQLDYLQPCELMRSGDFINKK